MVKRYIFLLLILLFCFGASAAQQRRLLYSKSLSPKLREIVRIIRNPKSDGRIDYDKLSRTNEFFARIAPRADILTKNKQLCDSNQCRGDAVLGGRPFVFLTIPESIYGRSLLEIYADIGYEAEDIIEKQRDKDMVVIIFRYENAVSLTENVMDGNLPPEWERKVYIPSWDNMFSLFHRLSENATIEPGRTVEFAPERTFFKSETEKAFVLSYPADAKQRIKNLSYYKIKARGGEDWMYRKLLEDKLSAFEHFRGDGRTQNEIFDREGTKPRFPEFVGPNKKVKDLPEVAIIHLGKLIIKDTYVKNR